MNRALAARCAATSWVRGTIPSLLLLALFPAAILPPAPGRAEAPAGRALVASFGGGYRIYNEHLGLNDDGGISLRLGMGLGRRAEVALDYFLGVPVRESTGLSSSVSALRALLRVNALDGPTRPYLIGGFGGLLFNFDDTADYSTGAWTVGAGVERRLTDQLVLRLEASTDLYRSERVTYTPLGTIAGRAGATTDALGTFTAAVGARF